MVSFEFKEISFTVVAVRCTGEIVLCYNGNAGFLVIEIN